MNNPAVVAELIASSEIEDEKSLAAGGVPSARRLRQDWANDL